MSDSETTQFETDDLLPALEKLHSGENLFAVSERVAQIGHFRWDRKNDRLETCSAQYARLFDLDPAAILEAQNSFAGLLAQIHPDDRERYRQACREAGPGRHLDIEYRLAADVDGGEARYLREIGVYLDADAGALRGDYGVLQDVTRRALQRAELVQRAELADQAEKLFDIGHYVYDEQRESYLFMSEGFARIHGTTVEARMQLAQSFEEDLEDVAEVDRDRVARAYEHYIATGEPLDIEYRIVRPDGELRWLRELNQARSRHNGRVLHTLGVLQDITRQKEIELELRFKDNVAIQAEIITDIGHFVFDEIADRYNYASPGLARIYGVEVDFLLHQLRDTEHDLEFVHADDRDRVMELYNQEAQVDENGYDNWQLEYRMVRPNGEVRWVREIGKTHLIESGIEEQTVGVVIDITEQKLAEQEILAARDNLEKQVEERTRELAETVAQLEHEIAERKKIAAELQFLANHDALTGLPALRLGRDRLQQAIAAAGRDERMVVIMFLDLDGFKQINDRYGHEAGDRVLTIVADRIRSEVREPDTVARIGGDEFLVILPGIPDTVVVEKIAANLVKHVGEEIGLAVARVRVGVSIGIALHPDNGDSVDELIKAADGAMYQVKDRGKNDYGFAGLNPARKIVSITEKRSDETG